MVHIRIACDEEIAQGKVILKPGIDFLAEIAGSNILKGYSGGLCEQAALIWAQLPLVLREEAEQQEKCRYCAYKSDYEREVRCPDLFFFFT